MKNVFNQVLLNFFQHYDFPPKQLIIRFSSLSAKSTRVKKKCLSVKAQDKLNANIGSERMSIFNLSVCEERKGAQLCAVAGKEMWPKTSRFEVESGVSQGCWGIDK